MNFGVYFLANDRVLEWAYPFLASFRKYNPDLPLTLIPYNDDTAQLLALSWRFKFDVLESETYAELDSLGDRVLSAPGNKTLRKMAAFWGVYEHFLYIDTDIVVTSELGRLGKAAQDSGMDLVYADYSLEHVYKPGELRRRMVEEYHTKAFITGNWWSRRGLFDLAEIRSRAEEVQEFKAEFADTWEQPFINYCCDVKRIKISTFAEIMPELLPTTWSPLVHCQQKEGRWVHADGEWAGRDVYMVHYAGIAAPHAAMANYSLYLKYRVQGQGALQAYLWSLRAQAHRIRWRLLRHAR